MYRNLKKYRVYLGKARANLGLQGWKVAEKAQMCPELYSEVENGSAGDHITFITICKIAIALDLSLEYVFEQEIKYQVRTFKKPYNVVGEYRPRWVSWRVPKSFYNYRMYLYEVRASLHYSIEQVSETIGIARSHYYAVESGRFTDAIAFNVMYRIFKTLHLDFKEATKKELEYLNERANGKYSNLLKNFNSE